MKTSTIKGINDTFIKRIVLRKTCFRFKKDSKEIISIKVVYKASDWSSSFYIHYGTGVAKENTQRLNKIEKALYL